MHGSNVTDTLKSTHTQTATVWTGDLHDVKRVLAAMKECVRRSSEKTKNTSADIQTAFRVRHMKQAQQSRVLDTLAVGIGMGFRLNNPRASDVRAALADAYVEPSGAPFLLSPNQLLGFIGTHE